MVSTSNNNKVMYKLLKSWLGLTVYKIFLKVWPPVGENSIADADIRLCILFTNDKDKLFELYREDDDIWEPVIKTSTLPAKVYAWQLFEQRIGGWMSKNIEGEFAYEYYDTRDSMEFSKILGQKVKAITLLAAKEVEEPFGLIIHTDYDYILSIPNSDGSIISTETFNKNNRIDCFKRLWEIEYRPVI